MSDERVSIRERLMAYRRGFKHGASSSAPDPKFVDWDDYAAGYGAGREATAKAVDKWMRANGITHAMAAQWVLR